MAASTEVVCGICRQHPTNLRTTPCAHTYCFECLNQWNLTKRTGQLPCPLCRRNIASMFPERNYNSDSDDDNDPMIQLHEQQLLQLAGEMYDDQPALSGEDMLNQFLGQFNRSREPRDLFQEHSTRFGFLDIDNPNNHEPVLNRVINMVHRKRRLELTGFE